MNRKRPAPAQSTSSPSIPKTEIAAVKSKATIERLNELAVRKIKEHSPDIWMAVPDVVEWEHIAGFKFPGLQELCQDIVIDDFLASLTNPLAEFEQLKSRKISHLFNQGYVSTMLVKSDATFRNMASKVLSETNPSFTSTLNPDSVKEVVYGSITKDDVDRPRLPFFSKATLDAVRSNLLAMGAKVSVKAMHLSEG